MSKKTLLYAIIIFIILNTFTTVRAQDWVKHSDSIYSNILKNNNAKAKEFLDLTEKELSKTIIVKDTLYADFLYRKGLVHYFANKESLPYFNKSLKIWERSKKKNPYKLMKIHYFIGGDYNQKQYYTSAYQHYEKCYHINRNNDLKNNGNFTSSIYQLLLIDYYKNKDQIKVEKYALEYIDLLKDSAYKNFDFTYINAYRFMGDTKGQEEALLQFLKNYKKLKLDKPSLLFKTYSNLSSFYNNNLNNVKSIKYGELAIKANKNFNLKFPSGSKLLFLVLINAYHSIGDNINSSKYQKLLDLYFPDDEIDYHGDLEKLVINEDYENFELTFKEYEETLLQKKDFNNLAIIYAWSITLFERSIIFKKEDIEKQIKTIRKNKNSLTADKRVYFDLMLAEYYIFTQEFKKSLKISIENLNTEDDAFRLLFYRFKSVSEIIIGMKKSAFDSAYKSLEIAEGIYGKDSPEIIPYLNTILTVNMYGTDNQSTTIATRALKLIYEYHLENTELAAQTWQSLAEESFKKSNYKDAAIYYQNSINIYEKSEIITNAYMYYSSLLGMAKCNYVQNDFKTAKIYLAKTKDFIDGQSNIMDIGLGDYYDSMGNYYFFQDNFKEAKINYEKAFEIYGKKMSAGRDYNYILCDYFLTNNTETTINKLEKYYKTNGNISGVLDILYILKYNTGDSLEARKVLITDLKNIITNNNSYFHLLSKTERETLYRKFSHNFEYLNTHLLISKNNDFLNEYINLRFYFKSLLFNNDVNNSVINEQSRKSYDEYNENNILISKYYENKEDFSTELEELTARNRELEKFLSQNKNTIKSPTLNEQKIILVHGVNLP